MPAPHCLRNSRTGGPIPNLALLAVFTCAVLLSAATAAAETLGRCGKGWLERVDGQLILHVEGTPYEMGYQQGALLKDHIRANMEHILGEKADSRLRLGPVQINFRALITAVAEAQQEFVPLHYFEEMDALALAADIPAKDVYAGNFLPELFHCSGFAVMNSATQDGELFHGRVLDYAIDWRLQEHAVLVVAKPDGGVPFVNVTYAGFIGSVTGMNAKRVSIGEMGGFGLGRWQGVPMAFLVREALQTAGDLDEAVGVFKNNPRTCEYYYVVADGNSNRAVGMGATPRTLELIGPGETHALLPEAVEDAVLLSAGNRYKELVRRVREKHGKIDAEGAMRLMDRPVAMNSNLHNALFAPKSGRLWVAHASIDRQPAADQTYHAYNLDELLRRAPDPAALEVPLPPQPRPVAAENDAQSSIQGREGQTPPEPRRGEIEFQPSEAEAELDELFRLPAARFAYEMKPHDTLADAPNWFDVTFPSPVVTPHEANNTVHCEYFAPKGEGKRPGVVVLHILGGDFELSRLCCRALADSGCGALFVKMPYYGPRRAPGVNARMISADPDQTVSGMRQAVLDIRRAAAWLASREEIDGEQLGVTGISLGGIVGSLSLTCEPRFKKGCFILAGGDMARVAWDSRETAPYRAEWERRGLTHDDLIERFKPIDPVTHAARARHCKILMLNAAHDEVIPRACTESLWQAFGEPPIIWWNAGHYTAAAYLPEGMLRMTKFFAPEGEGK